MNTSKRHWICRVWVQFKLSGAILVCCFVTLHMYVVYTCICMYSWYTMYMYTRTHAHDYSDTQKERKKDKATQYNTTQDLRQLFSKEKTALRWDSNPRLTHSRHDALPTDLLRQLSWLRSKSPIQTKAKQSKERVSTWWTSQLKLVLHERTLAYMCIEFCVSWSVRTHTHS